MAFFLILGFLSMSIDHAKRELYLLKCYFFFSIKDIENLGIRHRATLEIVTLFSRGIVNSLTVKNV